MTRRALILGVTGALFIAGFGYINDQVFGFESFTSGHLLPVIVVGLVFVVIAILHPLLFRINRSWMLKPSEMTLVAVLMMGACSIPVGGLMSTFTQALVMPFHWNRINPGWQTHGLLDYVPRRCLVDNTDHDEAVTAFITGARDTTTERSFTERITRPLEQVPWKRWRGPLLTWLPFVFLTAAASAGLALVVHRQWSEHECLNYPIADFVASLCQRDAGKALPDILYRRLFWIGFGIIFLMRLNNAAHVWFPEYMIPINTTFSFRPFGVLWPSIYKAPLGANVLVLRVFPIVIAFAFFLSSEVSLTLGLTQILWVLMTIPMVTMGVTMGTQYGKGGWAGWQRAGSYVALTLMLIYTGRQYYTETFLRAVRIWDREKPESAAVWAFRICMAATAMLVALTMGLGLEFPFSLGTILLMLMTFLIVSRISAETGLFWIHPRWQPYGALLGFFGCYTMKPEAIVVSALVCVILCINQGEALMPYLCNGLKLCEKANLSLPKVTGATFAVYVCGVILAVVVVLAASYDVGTPISYTWSYKRIPTMPFRDTEPEILQLKANGMFEQAEALPWYRKLGGIQPRKNFLWAAGFGFVAVIVFSILRLRLPWWPLHPMLFLLWATWPMVVISHSMLLGWGVKRAVVRFGGTPAIRKLRPLMVGIIAGEVAAAFFCMLIGIIFYICTGERQPSYRFIP